MFGAVAILAAGGATGEVMRFAFNRDHVFGLVRLFDLDAEANLPTWFSSASMLAAACLAWMIASARRGAGGRDRRYWLGIAAMFVYLSADEGARIHEMLSFVKRADMLPALLYYSWVLFGIVAVLLVGAIYLRFVLRLAPAIRLLFVLSAALFVGGSLGLEMVEAQYAAQYGTRTVTYAFLAVVEEVMEMCGLSLFVYALARQLAREGSVVVRTE
jgi:hypothetical protein